MPIGLEHLLLCCCWPEVCCGWQRSMKLSCTVVGGHAHSLKLCEAGLKVSEHDVIRFLVLTCRGLAVSPKSLHSGRDVSECGT